MSQPPAACPPEDAILAFVEGTKTGSEREAVEVHLGDCAACRRLVSVLARDATDGRATPPTEPAGTASELGPGSVVAGKYEILDVLGRGGMGVVLLAFHRTLRQRVALKFLLGEHANDAGLVSRFFREARAAAALGSDHVVRVLDADREPNTGEPFVALEYLEGRDLARVLREDGPLPITSAVDYVLQAAEALALAHRHAIVHRDVKPANLFLAMQPDGSLRLKVLDFGIAKVAAAAAETSGGADQTGPAMVLGSPRYMAPEQLKDSSTVDERADIWALGVTLFELLSNASPFGGTSLIELCASIATDPPRSLCELRPEVPPALETAIGGFLVKERDGRTAHMGELAAALAPFASAEGLRSAEKARRVTESRPSSRPPPTSASGAVGGATPAPLGEDSTIRATSVAGVVPRPRAKLAATWVIASAMVAAGAGALWAARGAGGPTGEATTRGSDLASANAPHVTARSTRDDAKLEASSLGSPDASTPTSSASGGASASVPPPPLGGSATRATQAPAPRPAPPPPTSASAASGKGAPAPPAPSTSPPRAPGLHRDGLTDRK